ncbi:MAG TPA: FliA/WhiG family RNA polymerase sigma factor [Dehalococcoidia bacterium]
MVSATADIWAQYVATRAPELRERLILQYAPLVKYVVGRLAINLPNILDFEDVLSYGALGLIEAVERFDPTKGVKFETYAIARIRGSIIDALRALDRLPRSVRQKARQVEQAAAQLEADLGRPPTDEEVARHLGITLERYHEILVDASWVTVSLDNLLDSNENSEGYPAVEAPRPGDEPDITRELERKELVQALAQAVQQLPERERLVVSLYYKDEMTMKEISRIMDISESRVCQLHAKALSRLRLAMQRTLADYRP